MCFSIQLLSRKYNHKICTHGEMDITTVFGTVIGGSNPSGCTKYGVLCARQRQTCRARVGEVFSRKLWLTTEINPYETSY